MQHNNTEERIRALGLKKWYPPKRTNVITPYDREDKVMFTLVGLLVILFASAIALFLIGVYFTGGLLGLGAFFGGTVGLGTIGYFIGKWIWERCNL